MLTTTGILASRDGTLVGVLPGLLRSYRTIPVGATQRVVQVPPIGSFLVDWNDNRLRVHVSAPTQRDLDDVMRALEIELARVGGDRLRFAWIQAVPA